MLYYDIVPCSKRYRGIDRWLSLYELPRIKSKKDNLKLIEDYNLYVDTLDEEELGIDLFNKLLEFYKLFKEKGVDCEFLVCDDEPIKDAYGYKLEFLGIDIYSGYRESLIFEPKDEYVRSFLNENGLCTDVNDIDKIIAVSETGNHTWGPLYIYSLKL